ncbi:MAG: flagellar hook-length control protein FliK [Actinomycetota bacterium]|nr:flagellar hook-length control protein FliK [Actinomycetota bacterium]
MTVVAPLRGSADGTYQVSLALHPEGLGTVQATVTVAGTALAVHLAADTPEAHRALAASLPQLQEHLASDGGQVSVTLQQGGDPNPRGWSGAGAGSRHAGSGATTPAQGSARPVDELHVSARSGGAARLVDMRL